MNRLRMVFPLSILLIGTLLSAAQAQEEETGHMHGPDGRHIAVASTFGASSGPSILSHHDLMITHTRQPGPKREGVVVKGCDVHSVVHRRGDPKAVIHREHNSFEPENGVYGSHMMYKAPGEYEITENVTMPDGTKYSLEFPIWVPDPHGSNTHQVSPLFIGLGGSGLLGIVALAFRLGHQRGRRAAALLSGFALATGLLPMPTARAEEEEAGHMHGPDGRHIAVASTFGVAREPLRAYPTPDRKGFAVQTKDRYLFRLSIENEELAPPDPNIVTLTPAAARAVGLETAAVTEQRLAGGLVTTGQVRPNPNGVVSVGARVAGRVTRVTVTPGQRIPAGHVVAFLNSTEIAEAQAASNRAQADQRQAEAALVRASAEVRRAQSQVAEAQAERDRARADASAARGRAEHFRKALDRQRQLATAGAFSQGPLEQARTTVATAEGELRQSQTALANLEAQARRLEQGLQDGVTARKEWEAGQAAAEQGRARVETAQRQLEIARSTLAREERLQREGLRNAREVQQSEADLEGAQLAVRSVEAVVASQERAVQTAQAQVDAARSGVAEAETSVAQARSAIRSALNRLRLLGATPGGGGQVPIATPIGGSVQTRPVNAGELVSAGETLCTILNAATVWVESNVFERDLARVRVGQRVAIAADAIPGRTFRGTVGYIGGEVNPETRAVRVRTVVPNRDERLKPNMFVRVMIGSRKGTTLTVPVEAIQEEGGEQVLFVEEGTGMYRRRPVEVGASLGDHVVVESGLKHGERVVTQGAYQLLAQSKRG